MWRDALQFVGPGRRSRGGGTRPFDEERSGADGVGGEFMAVGTAHGADVGALGRPRRIEHGFAGAGAAEHDVGSAGRLLDGARGGVRMQLREPPGALKVLPAYNEGASASIVASSSTWARA